MQNEFLFKVKEKFHSVFSRINSHPRYYDISFDDIDLDEDEESFEDDEDIQE